MPFSYFSRSFSRVLIRSALGEIIPYVYDCTTDATALSPDGSFKGGYKYALTVNKTETSVNFKWSVSQEWEDGNDSSFDFN